MFYLMPTVRLSGGPESMQDYWDSSAEAGAAKRTSAAFAEAMPQMQILARDGRIVKPADLN